MEWKKREREGRSLFGARAASKRGARAPPTKNKKIPHLHRNFLIRACGIALENGTDSLHFSNEIVAMYSTLQQL